MEASIHFGTDGWRGRIAEEFTFANVRRVSQAIASHLKEVSASASSPIVVGYDTRFLSQEFARAAAGVLAQSDIPVLLAATFAPTPVFSYAVVSQKALGAVVLTASHNPPGFNGLKLKSARGGSVSPRVTAAIEALLQSSMVSDQWSMINGHSQTRGAPIVTFDPRPAYVKRL
ncbi:MAG: phosphoglucomutase/phosphomannomutase family protein, partial [candidate division NC10 bacterium]|nr:phosphoglucomutase/phosphomannomutase family protein [candidate division NC10 bacterium]